MQIARRPNGSACCSIHHQAFDRGAISVTDDNRILISSLLFDCDGAESMFMILNRRPLRMPNRKDAAPKRDFLAWHREQVFRGEARD
jgi:putative restriction endonuclease